VRIDVHGGDHSGMPIGICRRSGKTEDVPWGRHAARTRSADGDMELLVSEPDEVCTVRDFSDDLSIDGPEKSRAQLNTLESVSVKGISFS
jgi:hypothetical protein